MQIDSLSIEELAALRDKVTQTLADKVAARPRMFEDKFLFASRINDGGTMLYMHPVDADGDLTPRKGLTVAYCPGCGDKIVCQRSN